jgi:hypothetical protein
MVARQRGIDFEVVRQIARTLPGVEDVTSSRGTAFKVRGKLLACQAVHKSAEPGSLMVRIGSVEREFLLAGKPDAYYLTDHYRGYPVVLVRLSRVSRTALRERLEDAVRFVSTAKRRARS